MLLKKLLFFAPLLGRLDEQYLLHHTYIIMLNFPISRRPKGLFT